MSITVALLLTLSFGIALSQNDCTYFKNKYSDASTIESIRIAQENNLQSKGFLMSESDIGYARTEFLTCRNCSSRWYDNSKANLFTTTARLVADEDSSKLSSFGSSAQCFGRAIKPVKSHPKYRTINGYGNNLKDPFMGSTGTPFGRYANKNYYDDIRTTRKSVSGNELPNPRKIVQDVLIKAQKYSRSTEPNDLTNLLILYITHDVAHQVPVAAVDKCEEIRCCTKGSKKVLSKKLSHSSCLPIAIDANDEFYKNAGVGCLNMIRSDMSSLPSSVQFGEVKNMATSFLDLSLVYGVEDSETREIRSFKSGKLNMNAKNLLPTDSKGKYTKTSDRLLSVPITAIFPALFARHHNKLAEGLTALNPKWNDEKTFQEARRINIAVAQKNIYSLVAFVFDQTGQLKFEEVYDETRDASTQIEFTTAAYRAFHYYVNSNMKLVDRANNVKNILLSDTFGKIEILEDNFDDVLRGAMSQKMNEGQFTEEMYNKFAKNDNGVGVDVFSIDIQRGRDHGLSTFLETKRKIGLRSDYKSFQELNDIFPQSYIDLLSGTYESVQDIDLIVGGSLETFLAVNSSLAGNTFGAIVLDHYKRSMASDIYFFSNPLNPYPFTQPQLAAIMSFQFNHLMCTNAGLDSISLAWFLVGSAENYQIPCIYLPPLDLTAWKDV